MRITEKYLKESCEEINEKLADRGNPTLFSVRNLSGGGGFVVEVTKDGRTEMITNIGETNREVHAYLQGVDDAIYNYCKLPKKIKKSDNLVNLKYKTDGGSVFNSLFTRCLNHEFDLSVELGHVLYLSSDIDEARNQLDITEYEYGRLLEQYKMVIGIATQQAKEGVRPTGNLDKFSSK